MTKLLLPVKAEGLETPRGEIDTCHTRTHALMHCVQWEYLLLAGGLLSCGRSELGADWGQSVFRFNGSSSPCVSAHLLLALHQLIQLSLLNSSSSSTCSRHSPALPHHQVSNVEVVPQRDDDEEGVQGSEVGDGHRWLYSSAASRPSERATLYGGG